jgi:hypothetical protein
LTSTLPQDHQAKRTRIMAMKKKKKKKKMEDKKM